MTFKQLRLLLIYTKDFIPYAGLITLLSYFVYFNAGNSALTVLIWFKTITSIIGVYFHQSRKSKELFFYLNNGLGKKELLLMSIAFDLGIWLVGIIIVVKSAA